MERLNDKYGFNCFSDSELDSESDEGEEYRYEHKYEMLIKLLKSTDASIKILKHRIYRIYISCSFILIFQRFYSKVNLI